MTELTDDRVALVLGMPELLGFGDALLVEGDHPDAAARFTPANSEHVLGCACCAPRTAAGLALAGLLHRRARNQTPYFRRVIASTTTEAGRAELAFALANDPLVSACFRLSPARGGAHPDRPDPAGVA